jgi:ribosomal protein S18 acetylase RimI-like enzyme
MSDLSFRYARQSDTPALVDLIERAYRGEETAGSWNSEAHLLKGPRTNDEEISTLIGREDSRFIIAESEGRIAGCCLVQGLNRDPVRNWSSADAPYIEGFATPEAAAVRASKPSTPCTPPVTETNASYFGMFAIDPGIHGGGLGKRLIAEAERRVQELWGANQMVMTVINLRTALIDWYVRRGYRLTGATLPFPFSDSTGETTRDFHLVEMRKDLR